MRWMWQSKRNKNTPFHFRNPNLSNIGLIFISACFPGLWGLAEVFTTFITHPLPLWWCACLSNLCVFEKGTELITAPLKSAETAAQKTVCLAPKQANAVRTRRCCVATAVCWSTHKGRSVNVWSLESLIWCQLKHYSRCSVNSSVNNWTIIIYWLQYLPATEKTLEIVCVSQHGGQFRVDAVFLIRSKISYGLAWMMLLQIVDFWLSELERFVF